LDKGEMKNQIEPTTIRGCPAWSSFFHGFRQAEAVSVPLLLALCAA
jgi:hypothetical protein